MKTLNEFVLTPSQSDDLIWRMSVIDYARFLNQKPTLGMFVPVDDDGNILEEPKPIDSDAGNWNYHARNQQYHQAIDRVIFEGFEITYPQNEYSTVVRFVGKQVIELNFHSNGRISRLIGAMCFDINTISDLCDLVTLKQTK